MTDAVSDAALCRLRSSIVTVLILEPEYDPRLQVGPVQHTLPDGQVITVDPAEAQQLGDALMHPSVLDSAFEGPDVAESAVISSLAHQEPALRKASTS